MAAEGAFDHCFPFQVHFFSLSQYLFILFFFFLDELWCLRAWSCRWKPNWLNLCSLLIHEGASQLRDKWSEYKQPRKLRKLASLFISPRGERVAVASGNQITILQKEDEYSKPCGTFTSKISCISLILLTLHLWKHQLMLSCCIIFWMFQIKVTALKLSASGGHSCCFWMICLDYKLVSLQSWGLY